MIARNESYKKTLPKRERWKQKMKRSGRSGQFLGQSALFARGGIAVNDAFGGSAVDDRNSEVFFAGKRFFDLCFDASFGDLIPQTLFCVLAQPFFSRCKVGHDLVLWTKLPEIWPPYFNSKPKVNATMNALFWIVDAFCLERNETRLVEEVASESGNPAAVVQLAAWPSDARMLEIAAEFNLSETAFVVERDGAVHLRWFTPSVEVDLCGHATLGASAVLNREAIEFQTRAGALSVRRAADRKWWLDFPSQDVEAVDLPEELSQALGVAGVAAFRSSDDWLLEMGSEAAVREISPDFSRLARASHALGLRGVIVTARSQEEGFDFVSRFFAPAIGIDEDPVTGSAHTKLAPFWSRKLGREGLRGRQLSRRGGMVETRLRGDRVFLGGIARVRSSGTLLK